MSLEETNRIQAALTIKLDELMPIDVRQEQDCRLERLEECARLAVRECRRAKVNQADALAILLRLWRTESA